MTVAGRVRCRYCAEEADVRVEGWRFGPGEGREPDFAVSACLVHRSTAKLKVTSEGYPTQTELDLGTWMVGVGFVGERRRR